MPYACNRRRLGRRGTTSLELALVMATFMWLLLGIMDLSRFLLTVQSVEFLADQAVRTGITSSTFKYLQSGSTCRLVTAETLGFTVPAFLDPSTRMCVNQSTPTNGGHLVTVTVTSPFTAMTPGLAALTSNTAISETTQLTY